MSSVDVERHMRESAAEDAARYIHNEHSDRVFLLACSKANLNPKDEGLKMVFMEGFFNGALSMSREFIVNGSFHSEGAVNQGGDHDGK